jgi:hypothetical protein
MSKEIIIKTSIRFVVYQILLIFTVLSIFFLVNPIYWGNRAPIIGLSYQHIFYPIKYDERVENFVMKIGRTRLYFEIETQEKGIPNLFEIIEGSEYVENEQWYNCEYQYVNKNGKLDVYSYRTRVKWKPWEFNYPLPEDLEMNMPGDL